MYFNKLSMLIKEAEKPIDVTKNNPDSDPYSVPPDKTELNIEEAIKKFITNISKELKNFKISVSKVNKDDTDYSYMVEVSFTDDTNYRNTMTDFLASPSFIQFKKDLGNLKILSTELDKLSALQYWSLDQSKSPKYTLQCKVNLKPIK